MRLDDGFIQVGETHAWVVSEYFLITPARLTAATICLAADIVAPIILLMNNHP